ncbi:MAG: UDP-3-O-(3-hydroxymyristoyl)glucosamine N-acyltransferase [Fimbriimonas sp.]
MAKDFPGWTLSGIAERLGGTLNGPADLPIRRLGLAHTNDPEALTFAENDRFLKLAEASEIGAILVLEGMETTKPSIMVAKPRLAFFSLLQIAHEALPLDAGVHPTAIVHPTATVDSSANIGAYVVIERDAVVGAGARIHPFCYVGAQCEVGEGTVLMPHVTLVQDVRLAANVLVQPGSVLGADGFGFVWDGKRHVKIPQVGGVRIADHVEIGALSAVDRAMAGVTEIGEGSKLDNFVQIAHNARVGTHTVIASQAGLSGSARVGNRVTIAGQTGVNHDTEVGDDIILGGRTGVTSDLADPGAYWGTPAIPLRDAQRAALLVGKLPDLLKRIKELEKKIARLEGNP